jgi:hypothetical protein
MHGIHHIPPSKDTSHPFQPSSPQTTQELWSGASVPSAASGLPDLMPDGGVVTVALLGDDDTR